MQIGDKTLGWISLVLVIIGMAPYFYLIYLGKVKPHVFSWLVWTVTAAIAFSAEYYDHGGSGAWSTGLAALNCLAVTMIAIFKGEHRISLGDVASLVCALLALPIWYFTKDPLGSVVIVTAIDVVGFYPTIRKSYSKPYEEGIFMYLVTGLNFSVALLAIEHWTMVTSLYPACTALACGAMVVLLVVRRRIMRTALPHS